MKNKQFCLVSFLQITKNLIMHNREIIFSYCFEYSSDWLKSNHYSVTDHLKMLLIKMVFKFPCWCILRYIKKDHMRNNILFKIYSFFPLHFPLFIQPSVVSMVSDFFLLLLVSIFLSGMAKKWIKHSSFLSMQHCSTFPVGIPVLRHTQH